LDDIVPALTGSAGNRLCCLTGMGGIGKTSLASRVAHQLREHFDGVLWGDVYHSEPLTILDTWARAFGCDFSGLPDLDSRAAAMRNVLADKRVLVVLDDVWRADRARPLLPNGDECAVLITTRDVEVAAALNLTPYMVEALSPFESYQLMANILRHDPRLAAEKPVADEICALLAHLPLAVEIAAQRLLSRPGWKLADMAQRLRDEHTRLGELKVSNRAVRASFELSWNVLDNDQRQCFAALGVFEGRTFAVPALAAVAAQDELTARGHLDSLVALSLLDEEGAAHYHQHPLLADFAREKLGTMAAAQLPNDKAQLREFLEQRFDLEEIKNLAFDLGIDYTKLPHETTVMLSRELISFCERREILGNLAAKALSQRYNDDMVRLGQDQVAYTRMAQYYLRFAQERKTQYAELEAEWNNIWAGLRAAHQRQMWQVVLEYVEVLQDTWFARGHYTDARKGYSWLAEAAENLENRQVLAEALVEWGSACISQNDYAEAEAHLMAGHQIYQVLDDQGGIANVFYHRGRIALDQGKHSEAQQLLLAAQDLWTKHGNQPHIARTLYLLASIQLEHGHFDEAEQLGIAALKLHRATHNDLDTVRTLTLLAEIARAQYNFDVAIDHCHQALALGETLHNRNESALTLYTLCKALRQQGKIQAARQKGEQSLAVLKSTGDRRAQAQVLLQLSRIHMETSNYSVALQTGQQSLELCRELNDPWGTVNVLRHLGDVQQLSGETSQARDAWLEGLQLAADIGHPWANSLSERLEKHAS
jgi:tetratricopeptide (TPR) repeat protein